MQRRESTKGTQRAASKGKFAGRGYSPCVKPGKRARRPGAAPQAPPGPSVPSGWVSGGQNEMPRAEARKQKAHRLSESRQVSECPGMEMVLHCANLSMFNQKLGSSPAGGLRKLLPPALRHGMQVKVLGSHCSSRIGQQSPQKWWVLRVVMVPGTVLRDKLGNGVFRRHLLMACGNGASSDVCDEVEGTRKQ